MFNVKALPVCLFAIAPLVASAQIIGSSTNMVSGTQWPGGDPFLQRQNGPSFAVSTRNPLHLISGDNDYRTVDIPVATNGNAAGDAWLGVFQSADGGKTWDSTLLPGYPQDTSAVGMSSPAYGYSAGTDPVMRPGTNGMAYYAGLAFNRTPVAGSNFGASAIVVGRYIDTNPVTGDPFQYLDTHVVAHRTALESPSPQFTDKPWIAVDIPRTGAQPCTVGGTSFPGGNVYVTYTVFTTDQYHGAITFQRSTDCGVTWGTPIQFTDASVTRQSTATAIDPKTGTVYIAWRQFTSPAPPATPVVGDAIYVVKSTDGGQTFSAPQQVAAISPFDQGSTFYSFRTNSYPAIVVDGNGLVYIAWSQRGVGPGGDARIVISTSPDGITWSTPTPVDNQPGRGHQFMPAITFAGGQLMLVYYDLRDDSTVGIFTSLGGGVYTEARQAVGDLATGTPTVFTTFVDDTPPRALRHTIDVRVAQGSPGAAPVFNSARVSSYDFGSLPTSETVIEQLQFDPPNFPLFSSGTQAYFGDYLDIAALMFVHDANGNWIYNTAPAADTVFHAAWTDNRDVRPPPPDPITGVPDWTKYTPPGLAVLPSKFDPTQTVAACVPGQEGMRNQNIYTARVTSGLVARSPNNSKPLVSNQLRTFVLTVENTASVATTFRATIMNQPTGGRAVFSQSTSLPTPLTKLDITIPALSTVARSIFSASTNPVAQVKILIQQVTGVGDTVVPGGLQSTVILNGDATDPNLAPGAVPPAELYALTVANPNVANPNVANPNVANPNVANPNVANPNVANPNVANPNVANPNVANPNVANPNVGASDLVNGVITDVTWTVTNTGSTVMAYTIKSLLTGLVPAGFKTQLFVYQVYNTPVSLNCVLDLELHTKLLINIPDVSLFFEPAGNNDSADPSIASPTDPTIALRPGETALLDLRFVNPNKATNTTFDYTNTVITTVTSHGANAGTTQPPVASTGLVVLTQSLPGGSTGTAYTTTLASAGGVGAVTWSTPNLPADGLSLNASTGVISGAPTGSASLSINITATDSSGKVANRSYSLTIVTPAAPTIASTSLPVGYPGVSYSSTLIASNGAGTKTWGISLGTLPAGLNLNPATGAITGIPTAVGAPSITFSVTDALGRQGTKALALTVSPITLAFSLQPGNVAPLFSQSVTVKATSASTGISGVQLSLAIDESNGSTVNTLSLTTGSGGTVSTSLSLPSEVYHLVASVTGATSATSNTFTVGSPQLVITVQPSDALAQPTNDSLHVEDSISVQLIDSTGAGISGANVTIAIGTNPASGTLREANPGNTTIATDATGLAQFAWSINNAGAGYTLVASSPGVASVTSNPFNVVAGYDGYGAQPAGGALPSPQTPSPDLTAAFASAYDGNLNLFITFAPGTYLASTTSTQIELDTDQNPGTGAAGYGGNPSQVMDVGVIGWDYLVGYIAGNATASIIKSLPGGFTFVGTVPVNNQPNGFVLSIPLATLGGISGKMNFTVTTGANSGGQFTFTDALPNVGLPPIVVNTPGNPAIELTSTGVQVASGTSLNAAVWLTQPAPAPGVTVNLSTSPSGVLTVPATVTVPTGLKTVAFLAPALASGTTTITATSAGYDSAQTTINVPLGSVTLPAAFNVTQGLSVTVPISLSYPSPAGGTTIYVSSQSTTVATVSTNSLFVPPGQTTPTTPLQVTGVAVGTTQIIASAAQFFGAVSNVTVTLLAPPPPVLSFVVQPTDTPAGLGITPAPQVQLLNYLGAPIPGVNVTIALGANPGSGTLAGTTTVSTDPTGTATFSGLSINNAGTGYTLVATAGVAAPVTSNAFDIAVIPGFDLTRLTLNPSAVLNGTAVQLTSGQYQSASAWLWAQEPIASGFSTSFTFQITPVTGSPELADGFAFVIQNADTGTSTIGQAGGAIGYGFNTGNASLTGIPDSLAIEFDTYQNSEFGDPPNPHIGIQSNGTLPNSENHNSSANLGGPVVANFADGNPHTATITYDGVNTLQVFLDGNFIVSATQNLNTLLSLNGGNAYVGFTAGTGLYSQYSNIQSWSWNNPQAAPIACSQQASLSSINGLTPSVITFTNDTASTRDVYWLDYSGMLELYNTLAPGQSYNQLTYVTHPWVITDTSNNCTEIFNPAATSSNAFITQ